MDELQEIKTPDESSANGGANEPDGGNGKDGGQKNEKGMLSISVKSFVSVVIILFALIIATGTLTYFIPRGTLTVTEGSFEYVELGVKGYPFWRWLTAPFEVLAGPDNLTIIMVSLFIVVLGGCFNVMDKTGGIKAIIRSLIVKFEKKKYLLMCLVVLIFMLLGAFFGIFEESVAMLPVIIMLSVSLGWDTFAGMGMCLLASCFGFSSAITNPFTVGIATNLAGIGLFSGIWLRILIFAVMYAMLCGFLFLYIKRLEKHPEKSPTYESDALKRKNILGEMAIKDSDQPRTLKAYVVFFISLFSILILSAVVGIFVSAVQDISMVIIMVTFLIGTTTAATYVTKDFKKVMLTFLKGALSIAPSVFLIMLSGSIKYILTASGIEGSLLYGASQAMQGMPKYTAVLIIFSVILMFNFFIGSASAKAILILPLILPISALIGLNPIVVVIAFVLADGFSNVIFPTNPVLLLGLSVSEFSYTKWFKKTALLQLAALLLSVGFLMLATAVY